LYVKINDAMWEEIRHRARERGFRSGQDYVRFLILADCRNNLLYMDAALHTFATWIGDILGASAGKVIFEAERAFLEGDTTFEDSKTTTDKFNKPNTTRVYKRKGE